MPKNLANVDFPVQITQKKKKGNTKKHAYQTMLNFSQNCLCVHIHPINNELVSTSSSQMKNNYTSSMYNQGMIYTI